MSRGEKAFWCGLVVLLVLATVEAGAQAVSKSVAYLRRIYALDAPLDVIGGVQTDPVRTGRLEDIDGGYVAVPRLDAGHVATGRVSNPDAGPVLVEYGTRTATVGNPDAGVFEVTGLALKIPVVASLPPCSATQNLYTMVTWSTTGGVYHCRFFPTSGSYGWTEPGEQTIATPTTGQRVGGHTLNEGLLLLSFTPNTYATILAAGGVVLEPGTCVAPCVEGNAVFEVAQGATRLCSISVLCTATEGTSITTAPCITNEIVPNVEIKLRIASDGTCTTQPAFNFITASKAYIKSP